MVNRIAFECTGLQGELEAAYKELTCVKNKLRLQESELDAIRLKCSDKEDDYNIRYSRELNETFFNYQME